MYYDQDEIYLAAKGRWSEIFAGLEPEWPNLAMRKKGYDPIPKAYCPIHTGKSGLAFGPMSGTNESGGMVCNTCGVAKGGIQALVMFSKREYHTALKEVHDFLGLEQKPKKTTTKSSVEILSREVNVTFDSKGMNEEEIKKEQAKCNKLSYFWENSLDLHKLPSVVTYYQNRGIALPKSEDVRCHPSAGFTRIFKNEEGDESYEYLGKLPVILHLMRDTNNKVVNILRTFINEDGSPLKEEGNKKMFPPIAGVSVSGSAIQLTKTFTDELTVGEGTETCQSWLQMTGWPTWALSNTALVRGWNPPIGVKKVNIIEDRDVNYAGTYASEALANRLAASGILVRRFIPHIEVLRGEKSVDWNDVLLREGAKGFEWVKRTSW
ncbi:toprim domain-containing protein [uncultured Shewanella sp.]|uniref:toprim domain-containing protein n=1 Tax=uncultured Shewanella sp. TaxID=173975 RepID=UPI0026333CA2|nr:toprim domain-containing protein [uncultured Shewanella sp.]